MSFWPTPADRVNDYQHYAVDAVQSCDQYADMGAQVGNHGILVATEHTGSYTIIHHVFSGL